MGKNKKTKRFIKCSFRTHKFIHPRNIYKNPPSFNKMAILYPEFRRHTITTLNGQVKLDFHKSDTLRALTQTLLKHDFGLNVTIPKDKLVPTMTLRLNYVLWIEDLLKYASYADLKLAKGIDIGTGCICIYSLIMAKLFGCFMTGTDIDEGSIESAIKTVNCNNLQHLVRVKRVSGDTILKEAVEGKEEYDFTVCNPPFFDFDKMPLEKPIPPRNAPTGTKRELEVEGGEDHFISKFIKESLEFQNQIKIYTTMLGSKTNLIHLIKFLKRENITNWTWTEFHQGYTIRWGLAWTFLSKETLNLSVAPNIRKRGDYISNNLRDEPYELVYPLTEEVPTIQSIANRLKQWCYEFNIQISDINYKADLKSEAFRARAKKVTWTHLRRERRLKEREQDKSLQSLLETSDNCNKKVSRVEEMATISRSQMKTEELYTQKTLSETMEYEGKSKECLKGMELNADFSSTPMDFNLNGNSESMDGGMQGSECNEKCDEFDLTFDVYISLLRCNANEIGCAKISLIFVSGIGGRLALDSFRNFLVNKLDKKECDGHKSSVIKKKYKSSKQARTEVKTRLPLEPKLEVLEPS
ncbi:RNA N6-adenosine-methyltransferase METTL16 [Prorops nasuta]|uniref:RNA N6-adenosine-methyltransferase METTL16 n=1 Tax=Prorops nasuta TaxID=863751 RepID=UPI0034D01026